MKREIWEIEKTSKIACIDLDGCLCKYPEYWINWVNKKTNNNFKNLNEVKNKLFFSQYKKLKIEYRESGEELNVPAAKDAKKFIDILRKNNYKVIILTARPMKQHKRLWKDTIDWLRENKITIDGIVSSDEKHWAVLKEFPYLKFMVEDNAEIANQIARIGYKVYVVDNEYNQQPLEKNCSRVVNLLDICKNEVIK